MREIQSALLVVLGVPLLFAGWGGEGGLSSYLIRAMEGSFRLCGKCNGQRSTKGSFSRLVSQFRACNPMLTVLSYI